MKFLVDAQLPRRLAALLRSLGFEVTHTLDLPDGNRSTDHALVIFSIAEQAVVITKDADFVQSFLLRREPWKLLLVSTGNIGNDELLNIFRRNIDQLVQLFQAYDFVELNRTNLICHLYLMRSEVAMNRVIARGVVVAMSVLVAWH